ncbi:hypothetical protein N0V83_003246 [Neocucurbitaria cava]|uniref:Uncharacterized protein n=1 Tax=Neocucurbitaria cava TaxID=798079 RepID=A0A9W8YE73_9PLEO|nr:hypothetical protein N0V83_003246 [Neocucurbitaria cava]
MDLTSDPPADFDDPELPSSVYGGELFGELFGDDMPRLQVPLWTLEEVGYTYDAPMVHSDGRIEGGLHSPNYYAYSPDPGSWEDGLQAIESFDWYGTKDSKQDGSGREDKRASLGGVMQSGATVDRAPVALDESSLVSGSEAMNVQRQSLRADTEPRSLVPGVNIDSQLTENSAELQQSDASNTALDSPSWISSLPFENDGISPTTDSENDAGLHPKSARIDTQQPNSPDIMDIDIVPSIIESTHLVMNDERDSTKSSTAHIDISFKQGLAQGNGPVMARKRVQNGKEEDITVDVNELNTGRKPSTPMSPTQAASRGHAVQEPLQPTILPFNIPTQSPTATESSNEESIPNESFFDKERNPMLPKRATEPQNKSDEVVTPYPTANNVATAQPLPLARENSKSGGTSQIQMSDAVSLGVFPEEPRRRPFRPFQPKHQSTRQLHQDGEVLQRDHPARRQRLLHRQVRGPQRLAHLVPPDSRLRRRSTAQLHSAPRAHPTRLLADDAVPALADDTNPSPGHQWQTQLQKAVTDVSSDDCSDSELSADGSCDEIDPDDECEGLPAVASKDNKEVQKLGVQTKEKPSQGHQLTSSRLSHLTPGKYSRSSLEQAPTSVQGLKDVSIIGSEAKQQKRDDDNYIDMTERYSDVDVLDVPEMLNPAHSGNTTPKEPRVRKVVSARELLNLIDHTPKSNMRNRRTKNEVFSPTPSFHDDLSESLSSDTDAENASALVEHRVSTAAPNSKTDVSTNAQSERKKRSSSVISMKMRSPAFKKPKTVPVKKAGRGRKATSSNGEEEEQGLPSAADFGPRKLWKVVTASTPSKNKGSQPTKTGKVSEETDHKAETGPLTEHLHPLHVPYGKRRTRSDTKYEESKSSAPTSTFGSHHELTTDLNSAKASTEHPEDSGDELADDWSHSAVANAKARNKAKAKTKSKGPAANARVLSLQPSRANTPAMSVASTSSTAATNKYGFTPPRGRRTRSSISTGTGATTTPAASPTRKPRFVPFLPKLKATTRGKARKSDGDASAATADEPDRRTTRRASALAEEIRKKEKDENVKLRLRGRDKDGKKK